ncbi:PAS domain S-box protein [Legionella qingyii]|uniref:PAS domain S-box protein n=1 Tax=Legionella qingyii TaxID=2184757 RepID=UPI000F8EBA1B|nr:PAS domain S-box protein [Legionella qingyii]RUR22997.1 PAS domain S-box protein [Legionella qingyii]
MEDINDLSAKYYTLFETAYDAIFVLDGNCFVDCNKRAEELFETTHDKLIGSTPADYSPNYQPDGELSKEKVFKKIEHALSVGPQSFEWEHQRENGSKFMADVSLNKLTLGNKVLLLAIVRDITERKHTEALLYDSEARFRALSEQSLIGIYIINNNVYTYVNSAFAKIIKCTPDELIGTGPILHFHPDSRDFVTKQILEKISGNLISTQYQAKIFATDNATRHVAIYSTRIILNHQPAIIGSILDITEQRHALEEQEKNILFHKLLTDVSNRLLNAKLGQLNQEMADGMQRICEMLDIDAVVIWEPFDKSNYLLNSYHRRQVGPEIPQKAYAKDYFPWCEQQLKSEESLVLSSIKNDLPPEAKLDRASFNYFGVKSVINFQLKGEQKNIMGIISFNMIRNERIWTVDEFNKFQMVSHLYSNAFSRKKAEEKLLESESRFRILSSHSLIGVFIVQDELFTYVNSALASVFGYTSGEMIGMNIRNLAHPDEIYRMNDTVLKRSQEIDIPLHFEFLGVKKNGEQINLEVYSSETILENKPAVIGSVLDITERKLAEQQLKNAYTNLKKSLDDTIVTMAKIVELRDPYTAGHQERVAQLAVAIATEMGVDPNLIEQLKMAAIIHDIGKINVPTELLSKPGKLADLELQLIKTHVQSGYEIVKNMNLLPDVAQIIYQHHERLDGSGYPNHLKGNDIRLEAKILAVADLVEAMSSHRPYRPARGIDVALDELCKNSGELYDPEVCKTCIKIFKENKFKFHYGASVM